MTYDDRLLGQLLQEFPEIVLVLSANGNLLWANQMAEKLFALSLEESVGVSALEFVHPDDFEIVLRSLETVQEKELGNPIEIRVKIASKWRLIELIGVPVGWLEVGALLFSLRDLTDRRRFELARDDVAQFRSLVHNATTIMLLVSPRGEIQSVSGALTRMLGHDPELVEQEPLSKIVAEDDHSALAAAIEDALLESNIGNPVTIEVKLLRHGSSESIAYELSIVNLLDDPTVGGLVVTAHDVSARVTAELELQGAMLELRHTFSLLNATLESTADGILVVDTDRTITSFNRQFTEMWQISNSVLEKRDDFLTVSSVVSQLVDPDAFLTRVDELYSDPLSVSRDVLELKDGRVFERSSKPQYVSGKVVGRVWSFKDITEQKRLEDDLAHLAFHDVLTGLPNRALFRDRLDQAIARSERTGKFMAVLFLDVDNFKTINDSLGHSVGDDLLRSVGDGLVSCLRRSDTAARLGGDEFAVLIEDVQSREDVLQLAARILKALRKPMTVKRQRVSVTVSLGITFGVAGSSSEQLLRNADLAMYLAKTQGKDRFEEFEDEMHTAVMARLELETDLRKAVIENEFTVYYQPLIDLETDRIVGLEALVRWIHPTRGLLQPEDFVLFAEEIGFIDAIDNFVLSQACNRVHHWQQLGIIPADFLVSVNLSARELVDLTIRDTVAECLSCSGLDPSNLILEITESAVMKDVKNVVQNLHSLKALGLRIAIDDFGTGYSSFSLLEALPIDILKIDKSFVVSTAKGKNGLNLAQAMVQLCQIMGLIPIGEGVEDTEQATGLREMGCRLAQGFHLGIPLDAESTEELLRARTTSTSTQ